MSLAAIAERRDAGIATFSPINARLNQPKWRVGNPRSTGRHLNLASSRVRFSGLFPESCTVVLGIVDIQDLYMLRSRR